MASDKIQASADNPLAESSNSWVFLHGRKEEQRDVPEDAPSLGTHCSPAAEAPEVN